MTKKNSVFRIRKFKKNNIFNLREFYRGYALFFALLIICIFFSILNLNFMTKLNILNILNQTAVNGILAIGVTYIILTKEIELGLGSYVVLTGVIAAIFAQHGDAFLIVALLMAMLVGALIGAINGIVVTKGSVAPFIVTLGMMTIARGLALVISGGRPISGLAPSFNSISKARLLGIPLPVIILGIVFLLSLFILN